MQSHYSWAPSSGASSHLRMWTSPTCSALPLKCNHTMLCPRNTSHSTTSPLQRTARLTSALSSALRKARPCQGSGASPCATAEYRSAQHYRVPRTQYRSHKVSNGADLVRCHLPRRTHSLCRLNTNLTQRTHSTHPIPNMRTQTATRTQTGLSP